MSYTLDKDISSASIVYTRTSGVEDSLSPHTYLLTNTDMTKGVHTVSTDPNLVDGAIYTVGFENIVDADGNSVSSVSNINVGYSSTAIAITDTIPAADSTVSSATVGYTLSGTVLAGKITYTWTGGNWDYNSTQVYTTTGNDLTAGPHTINTNLPLVDGAVYTVTFEATDTAGSQATTVSNASVTANLPLTINITSPADGSYVNRRSIAIEATLSQPAYIQINGMDYGYRWDKTLNYSIELVEGENIITVTVTDLAGETAMSEVKVFCDSIAPVMTITTPVNNSYLSTRTVSITGMIDTPATVKAYLWDYDSISGSWEFIEKGTTMIIGNIFEIIGVQLREGFNGLHIKAIDLAGNESRNDLIVYVDTIVPVITITTPIDGGYVKNSTISISGSISEYSYIKVNGQDYGYALSFSKTVSLAEGENNIVVTATDLTGNTSTASIKVTKDTIAPVIFITAPANGSYIDTSTFNVSGTVDDDTAVVTVNGVNAVVSGNTFTAQNVTFNGGSNTITAVATDKAGNTATASITVIRDTTPPVIVISIPANGSAYKTASVAVAGIIDDNTAIVSVNGVNASVGGNAFSASGIPLTNEGPNTVTVTATDLAGNISSTAITVYLDTTPPQIALTTPVNNAISVQTDTEITVKFNESIDPLNISSPIFTLLSETGTVSTTATYNEATSTAVFKPISELVPNTSYTATIKSGVKDTLGNATTVDYSWSFKTGAQSIKITITEPYNGAIINKTQTLVKGTVESMTPDTGIRVNGIIAEINGNNWTAIVPLQAGANTIMAEAVNAEGGTGKTSITINTQTINQPVKITSNPQSGIAPLNTTFSIDTSISNPITSYKIDFEGDGIIDLETTDVSNIIHIYETPGIYYPKVTVTDNQNNTYTETTMVNVLDKEQMDILLKGKWEGMKGALGSGDIDTAINFFEVHSQETYRSQFTALKSALNAISIDMGQIYLVKIEHGRAEYEIIAARDGVTYSFYLLFIKDQNGLWKIGRF